MDVVHPRCCGIDVHQATYSACVSIKDGAQVEKHKLRGGTTVAELAALEEWLRLHRVTHVAMEATGVYWKPLWHALVGKFELLLANPATVKALRGRKGDFRDGDRICDYLQHGLLQGSFVPPPEIQELRDLTRNRTILKQEQGRIANRIMKVLEEADIKLSSVMSDVMGASGRDMLHAIIAKKTDAAELAELARGRLRGKIPLLRKAAEGHLTETHRFLLENWLEEWEQKAARIAKFEERIEEKMRPFEKAVRTWMSLPGIDRVTAWTLVAELGADMRQFPTAEHAASWAALCPGEDESAGKRKSGRTRRGDTWLRGALTQAAWAATFKKDCYFRALYQRLAVRKGPKSAIVAVAHALLVTGYTVQLSGREYKDLGADYYDRRNRERLTKRLVRRLEGLGHKVTLQAAA